MTNNMYTHEERQIIVQYLVDNNISGNLQGNALWKRMEQEGVLNRTWQSMRSHFKTTIINMLHLYGLSEYQRKMILHGFGRKARPITSTSTARPVPAEKQIPFSSDSDSDTTVCVAVQAKRPRRDSGSNASLDLLTCDTTRVRKNADANDNNLPSTSTAGAKTKHDIRSYMISTAETDVEIPTTSTPKPKHHKKRQPKHDDTVVILDSDDDEPIKAEVSEQQIENNMENEPFSLEEDTQLILFFKTHQCYLADIRNNFAYIAFNYDTPTSIRTPKELRTRFVEHIMPNLYTYDCLTYEEMITYYDRADVDVPAELQQIISKTVAEQKKNKQVAATKVTVDVSTQAERSIVDKMISTDVPEVDMVSGNLVQAIVPELVEQLPAQDQPNLHNAEVHVVRKPTMVDASTQVQQASVDKLCNNTMVDASTQVQQPTRADKLCNTECQCQVNASTQTQQHRACHADVTVQHVEFVTDNMLHIFLPDHDDRRPLQDLQNIYGKAQNNAHMIRQKKYRLLNDKRYVDVAADSSVRQIAIDKCQAELVRLTAEVKRLEGTLGRLRGYEAKEAVSDNKENNVESHSSLAIKNEQQCTNVLEMSNNTTVISSTAESLTDSEADISKSDSGSQTVNKPALMFDTFQIELDKKHMSTQINTSGGQQMDTSQDGDQEEDSTVIAIQPDIEFCTRPPHQPMEVEETSDESEGTEPPTTDNASCQTEPLNLSTSSHESVENVNVLSTNSEKFYSAVSQE